MSDPVADCMARLDGAGLSPFDLLPGRTFGEKLIELALSGPPSGPPAIVSGLRNLAALIHKQDCGAVRVVVFGGGTGLSTIIGGDSLALGWIEDPFQGLKEVFPRTTAVVCTTDDGGSTGELLKDLPLIGLGDIRHVLLSSVQERRLRSLYGLSRAGALDAAAALFTLFNHRYHQPPAAIDDLIGGAGLGLDGLPPDLAAALRGLLDDLFSDPRLRKLLVRPHCLGNLLLVSAIYRHHADGDLAARPEAIRRGLNFLAERLGAAPDAVLPCTTTPSLLRMRYANGVEVTGESKSGDSRRGYPVDRVLVDFSSPHPHVLPEVVSAIAEADIIIFAPGSLYTSIVPVMQVPGLAGAVAANRRAFKLLTANLWVQQGETDLAMGEDRRFHVSDLIKAYHRNIPGGVAGLFHTVLLLGMQDIPGSILQRYAIENKEPIYLDRGRVWSLGFQPVEAAIYSQAALQDYRVKHDPRAFATAVKTMWIARDVMRRDRPGRVGLNAPDTRFAVSGRAEIPCRRYAAILAFLQKRRIEPSRWVADILWRHWDIPLRHLDNVAGLRLVEKNEWNRSQQWDNIYSFYDPEDGLIKVRKDMLGRERFEVVLLVALGQSLLGNYAAAKTMAPLEIEGRLLGKIYSLRLRPESGRNTFLSDSDLRRYLALARMRQSDADPDLFTRVLNGSEGFTPPGLLFGLTYAWYLDNRFAPHIEYKMAIARTPVSNMVPEQIRTLHRRQALVDFFRDCVFATGSQAGM